MMMSLLSICVLAGCATTEFARPPLPERPMLKSATSQKNAQTGEPGFWLSRPDVDLLGDYFETVEAVRKDWK
jgi:hypothetical protein